MIKFLLMFLYCGLAYGVNVKTYIPAGAVKLLPQLKTVQQEIWPDAPMPYFLAGQIEQESCISLTHSKCWNPRAELKTARENGIGLGQYTRAYNKNGTIRFDKISELVAAHKSLKGWSWEKRYDAGYQLTALVEMDKAIYKRQKNAFSVKDALSFTLSGYNGGEAGVLQDRLLCSNTRNCDSSKWAGNVEKTSLKKRRAVHGYGKSFFDINREYVSNILELRCSKYSPYFED